MMNEGRRRINRQVSLRAILRSLAPVETGVATIGSPSMRSVDSSSFGSDGSETGSMMLMCCHPVGLGD